MKSCGNRRRGENLAQGAAELEREREREEGGVIIRNPGYGRNEHTLIGVIVHESDPVENV